MRRTYDCIDACVPLLSNWQNKVIGGREELAVQLELPQIPTLPPTLLCHLSIKDRTIHYARMTCVLYVMFAHTVTGTHYHGERDPGAGECRSRPLRRPTVSRHRVSRHAERE